MELFKLFGTIAVNNDEANRNIDETTGRAEGAESKMSAAFKKIGAAVATYFATEKIIAFGQEIVNVAAEVAAEASAFDQIMGDYANQAAEKVGRIADATGMVSTRLTPYMTSMTAKFKGLGYDIADATDYASRGLNLAADAAAFWDKSLDESMGHLNSFINGSYEGGEAIGLFANDTQMASYAVKQGIVSETKEWASLDEARKQATRLEYAEAMFAMSGATGQAAKESEQYANVQANLTEKWRQFKAQIGEPLLQNVVLPAMEKLSVVVDKASTGFEKLKKWVSENKNQLKQAANTVLEVGEAVVYATGVFAAFKAAMMIQKAIQGFQSAQVAVSLLTMNIGKANLAQAALNGTMTIGETIVALLTGKMTLAALAQGAMTKAQAALNAVMKANTIAIVITAIAALVAAFIYLWNNCEGFREFWINLWEKIKTAFEPVIEFIKSAFDSLKEKVQTGILPALKELWSAIKEEILPVLSLIWDFMQIYIKPAFEYFKMALNEIKIVVKAAFEIIKTVISTAFQNIKVTITTVWNVIKTIVSTALDVIKNVIKLATAVIRGDWSAAWDAIKGIFSSVWNGIKNTLSTVWNGIKSIFSNNLNAIKSTVSTVFNAVKSTISNVINGAKNIVSSGLNAIKGFFDKLKIKFPDIKLPHFKITGSFSLNPPSVPKLSIDWYKKAMDNAMLLNSPTIFGMNASGQLMGGGEAGQEVVSGSNTLMEMIRSAVKTETSGIGEGFERLISILDAYFPEIIANAKKDIILNNGVLVGQLAPEIDSQLGNIDRLRVRGQ